MQCMSVDLPEPEGPMMAVKAPLPKLTETRSSATTCVSPRPYTLTTSSA